MPSLATGVQHLNNENYEAAAISFQAIADNDPKNASIYYYIGEVHYVQEQYQKAEEAYMKGLDISF